MILQTAKIVSAPSKDCWSQVHLFSPKEPFKRENYGHLLAVIKIEPGASDSEAIDLPSFGKEVISRLHEEYYTSAENSILEKLKKTLEKIQKEFGEIKLEIVAGAVWNGVLYLSILNRGKTALLRERTLVTILEGKGELVTASGFWQGNDLFVLGTERFFQSVPQEILTTNLINKDPEAAIEALGPVIHGREDDGGAAAVIAKLGREETPKEEKLGKFLTSLVGQRLFSVFLVLEKTLARLKSWFRGILARPRPVYLPQGKKKEEKKQRMMLTIAVILTVLLLISIILGWRKKRKEEEVRRFNQFWEEIKYKYEQGKELVELNPLRARELLKESRQLVKERKDDFTPKNWQYKRLVEVEGEIEGEMMKVLREYELTEVPVFLDFELVKRGLKGIDLDFWEKRMVVLGEDGTVVTIDLNKKAEIKGLVEGGKLVTFWGEKAFILGEKIVEVGNKTEIKKEWREVVGFEAFAGNLYLLDKEKNKVWKYPVIESGFGAGRSWFGPGIEPDLTEAVDISIDGDIWILLGNGEILKFSVGIPQAFGVTGLDQKLNHPTAFYTDEGCKKIYVLDKGNKRIVVLRKSGEYDSQYIWEGMESVSDIVVSESEKKMLLLSGEKLYEIEIR